VHLFFDLDGTLTDSSPGILRCIDHALTSLGRDPIAHDRVAGLIGAPLSTIFEKLLGSPDESLIDRAIEAYRARFNTTGIFENALFPGIVEALAVFQQSGHRLRIVTAKPRLSAEKVVDHFGIGRFFDAVHGPELSDRSCHKADFLATALESAAASPRRCAMIGDRADDVLAARACEVPAVAVGWGYGSRTELLAAGPSYFAEQVGDLLDWVSATGKNADEPTPSGIPS
jgi:phosphoglycolate phosphatase